MILICSFSSPRLAALILWQEKSLKAVLFFFCDMTITLMLIVAGLNIASLAIAGVNLCCAIGAEKVDIVWLQHISVFHARGTHWHTRNR